MNDIAKDYYSNVRVLTLNICIKSAGFFWNTLPSCDLARSAACNIMQMHIMVLITRTSKSIQKNP